MQAEGNAFAYRALTRHQLENFELGESQFRGADRSGLRFEAELVARPRCACAGTTFRPAMPRARGSAA